MKASVITALAAVASVSATYGDYPQKSTTSTVYATSVYTTKGAVTTDYVSLYETVCPVTETEKTEYPATTYPAKETYPAKDTHTYPAKETVTSYPVKETYPAKVSTVCETKEYTITSCKPEVTNCPYGSKTYSIETKTYTGPVVTYPASESKTKEYKTSTVYETKEYTISSCKPEVTNCPYGSKTYETKTMFSTYPVETVTTIPYAHGKPSETYPSEGKPTESGKSYPQNPVTSVLTISTCVPSYVTSVVTVYPSGKGGDNGGNNGYPTSKGGNNGGNNAYPTKPTGTGSVYPPKNTTTPYVPVTGAASGLKVGGLLMAAGLVAALF